MSGVLNDVSSDGSHTNGNINISPSSLSAVAAVAVAFSLIRRVYSTQSVTARQYIFLFFVKGMRHFFPFSLPLIILVLVGPFDLYFYFNSIPCLYLIQ